MALGEILTLGSESDLGDEERMRDLLAGADDPSAFAGGVPPQFALLR